MGPTGEETNENIKLMSNATHRATKLDSREMDPLENYKNLSTIRLSSL